ncbi:MAG: hypothetical protein JWN00_3702 [Actinomycetia bacterium]|nr:hypothetical protein [Actinomycetes bacterium]
MDDFDLDMPGNVAAFEQTVRSTIALADGFEAGDWELPTECPGWTVKDQLAHLVGVERMLLGDSEPVHELPADLPHVRNDFARLLEVPIDARRPVPGPQVLAELRETLERRLAALATTDPTAETMCPDGKLGPYSRLMMFRAFDCWVHEQDIRRATGHPGNLDSPAGARARQILSGGLPFVVGKRARAEAGQSVLFEVSGPHGFRTAVLVGEDRRARVTEQVAEPTVELDLDWEAYLRLAAGRCGPAEIAAGVHGDADLAARVLASLAITP